MLQSARRTINSFKLYSTCAWPSRAVGSKQLIKRHVSTTAGLKLPLPADIDKIIRLRLRLASEDPSISENLSHMKVQSQKITAKASLRIKKVERGEMWAVGFIQAVSLSEHEFNYGKYGDVVINIPRLKGGIPMVCDCEGGDFPWYSRRYSREVLRGPLENVLVKLILKDHPGASTTWNLLFAGQRPPSFFQSLDNEFDVYSRFGGMLRWFFPPRNISQARLTKMKCQQHIHTWLVVQCLKTEEIKILKTVNWTSLVNLDVDVSKAIGSRGTIQSSSSASFERMENTSIPDSVFLRYGANDSHQAIFKPGVGNPTPLLLWGERGPLSYDLPDDDGYSDTDSASTPTSTESEGEAQAADNEDEENQPGNDSVTLSTDLEGAKSDMSTDTAIHETTLSTSSSNSSSAGSKPSK